MKPRNKSNMKKMASMADIDEVMWDCGLECLHPGGLEKTDEMVLRCGINEDKNVLDVGAGKGVTPCYLAEKYKCKVVGIDHSEKMLEGAMKRAREKGLEDKVSFRKADIYDLLFNDESFDIVIAECATTMLDMEKAFPEMFRVLRHGGVIGDLEMTWRKEPTEKILEEVKELWGDYDTKMFKEWKTFLERMGFTDVIVVDFSQTIADMDTMMKKMLGFSGMLKMTFKLMLNSPLRRAMKEYGRFFKKYQEYIGYAYFVGRKP